MTAAIRIATAGPEDEDILWEMLYYAAQMEKDGASSYHAAKTHPFLQRYVQHWGSVGDYGVIAWLDSQPIGAAWARVLPSDEQIPDYFDAQTPELAIAVRPTYIGHGFGTQLLQAFLSGAQQHYQMVGLTVRADNPACRLYQRLGFRTIAELTNRVGSRSYAMVFDLHTTHLPAAR